MAKKRTPEQKASIVNKIDQARANGTTSLSEAIKPFKIQVSQYYEWKKKLSSSNTKVITYSGKQTKPINPKTPKTYRKRTSQDLFLVLGDPDQLARFYRAVQD